MKNTLLFIFVFALPSALTAQKAEESEAVVGGINRVGYRLLIDANKEIVEKEWVKFWKETGKIKRQRGYFSISEINFMGLSASEAEAYSELQTQDAEHTWVWINVEAAAMGPGLDIPTLCSQILQDFEFQFYRSQLTRLIAEAEEAESFLSKSSYRSEKEISRLNKALERNAVKRERLEEKIKKNEQQKANIEESLVQEQALRQQALKDLEIIQARLQVLREKLANFVGKESLE